MSWNIVLNKFIEIKNKFIEMYGEEQLWNYDSSEESCLDYWVRMIGCEEYTTLIAPLQLNEFQNKLLIRYGQFSDVFGGESELEYSDFWSMFDGFYMECRSVVIDVKVNKLVLAPFRKFRNINECEENSEENIAKRIRRAKCVEVTDKLDGSMQSARWYDGEIVMSGSQALDPACSFRLEDGYRIINENENYQRFLIDYCGYTSIFEYISLQDQHVVKYSKEDEGLYLIGMRNINTGDELPYHKVIELANKYELRTTKMHNKSFDEIMASLDDKKSDEAEGFVMDIDGYKVKIKYNDYVNMHGILSALSSPNLIIHNIADGTWDDFIAKVPVAHRDRVFQTADKVFAFIKKKEQIICDYYNELKKQNLQSKKDVMIWIDANIPKQYKGYVRSKYLDINYNLIRNSNGHYLIMKDIVKFLEQK